MIEPKQKETRYLYKILCVDDETAMLEGYARLLHSFGYESITATNGKSALDLIKSEAPHILLTDLRMPEVGGMALLEAAKKIAPEMPVIVITAHATIPSAVEAVRKGAFDYIPKPFSAEQLEVTLKRAEEYAALLNENRRLRLQLEETSAFPAIVGDSSTIRGILETVQKIAPTEANVLISGESGTGKELVARYIHANSSRFSQGFIPVDCAALPESILESELFGHEKGAFTGASTERSGLFEHAHMGTIFLDEVGELALNIQAKLLRVLQERKVRRLGSRVEIDIDIRIIAASNRDLAEAVIKKEFREDLFYRLNVIMITLPPLRERLEDIPLLATHFLHEIGGSFVRPATRISLEALQCLQHYAWPGNVRELRNVIERALSLCESDEISGSDLPDHVRNADTPAASDPMFLPLREARRVWLEPMEKEYLRKILERHKGNISEAARSAEIDRQTIYRMLSKYNIRTDGD